MMLDVPANLRRPGARWFYPLFICAAIIQWLGPTARGQVVDARIASVKGVAVRYNNQRPFTPAKGDALLPGDEIDTLGGGRIVIGLTDGSIVVVQPNSRIFITDYRTTTSLRELFRVIVGRVRVKINHYGGKPNPYRVNSPTASILVRGTEFGVAVDSSGDTRVVVYEGLVEVESLSDPQRRALVSPGKGVLVRPNEDIRFFIPGPGSEISDRGNSSVGGSKTANNDGVAPVNNGDNGDNDDNRLDEMSASASGSIRKDLAGDYERYIDSLVEPGQSPPLMRFLAFSDSHFDSFDNPAYATEFAALEGNLWLIPSLSRALGRSANTGALNFSFSDRDPLSPLNHGFLGQGSLFVPVERWRGVIGGVVAASSSRLHSFNEAQVVGPPVPLFPNGTPGMRRAASRTETSSIAGSLIGARKFGRDGRTSIGIGVEFFSGEGGLNALTSLINSAGLKASERLTAGSEIDRMRFQFGLTHEFKGDPSAPGYNGSHKLGLLYRHGLATAEDRDRQRLFNTEFSLVPQTYPLSPGEDLGLSLAFSGLPLTLDSVRYEGRSSEMGFKLRGPLTRRLFYGVEGSWLNVHLNEEIRRALIVDSTERERITRAVLGFGLGYALRRRTLLSADLAFGASDVREKTYEDATGNLIQDERPRTKFASVQLGVQTDLWRRMFVSASVLAIRQARKTDLKLYPDQFGRKLTSYGLAATDGRTRETVTRALSDFGAGWRFTPNLLFEYVLSVDQGFGPPQHVFLLRYTFRREK